MTQLSAKEAYLAMFAFLEEYYVTTQADDIGALLGSLSVLDDDGPADPAITAEWACAVEKAKDGSLDARLRLPK